MADSPFGPFGGAAKSSEAYQRALNEFYGIFPPDTMMGDPARRERAAKGVGRVGELTAELAVIARTVPGKAGQLLATLVAGVEKQPDTGKVFPVPGTATNLAPSPLGLMDPKVVGLEHNFYLPSGVTNFVPKEVHGIIPGMKLQAEIDHTNRVNQLDAQQRATLARARQFVALESDATLEQVLRKEFPLGGQSTILKGRFSFQGDVLDFAAQEELARRRAAALPPVAPRAPGDVAIPDPAALQRAAQLIARLEAMGQLTDQQKRVLEQLRQLQLTANGGLNPFAAGAQNASIHLANIVPVVDAAIRNAEAARGIRRELIHERADP